MLNRLKNRFKERESRQNLKSRSDELITNNNPKSPVAEAYRKIRTNLNFMSPDKPLKTIVFTSSGASEGKSTVLANLAIALAQNEQKTIIIDADMRKPMQHKFFEMTNFSGLSDFLSGETEFDEALRETGIDGVSLISTGLIPPNPSELLASRRMGEILKKAREKADIVLVDTPPVLAVTDSTVLATKVDGVILIVASNQTNEQMLVKVKESLDNVNANVVGAILNKYPVQNQGYGYYQHYYYNYYGG